MGRLHQTVTLRQLGVTFDQMAVGLIFVAAGVIACFSPAQGDTWWHLRLGFDFWHTHAVPLVDTYSFTAAGTAFSDHGWLTDALFAVFYKLGGMPGVAAACAASILFAWSLSWRLADGPFEVGFVALLTGIMTSTISWALRPQVFSMAALMVVCTLLVSNRPRVIPIVFLIWANLHSAVLLGLVVMPVACVAALVRDRRLPTTLMVVTALSVVAVCCTPMGLRFWPEILTSLEKSKVNGLTEWRPPGFQPFLWPFWAMAAALPVLAVWFRRRLKGDTITMVAIAFALLPLAARSIRNVPMFLLVAVPALTMLARSEGARDANARRAKEHIRFNATILVLAAAVGAAFVALSWTKRVPVLGWQPLSPAAIAAVRACDDPLYNTFEGGGALIWFVPQKKVFIDNRQDPYPEPLLAEAHEVELDGRYGSLFARYGFRCAVVPSALPTDVALRHDAAWSPSYADGDWAVFTRR